MDGNSPLNIYAKFEIDKMQSINNIQKAVKEVGEKTTVQVNGINFDMQKVAKDFNKVISTAFHMNKDNVLTGYTTTLKNELGEILTLQSKFDENGNEYIASAKAVNKELETQKVYYEELRKLYEKLGNLQAKSISASEKKQEAIANEVKETRSLIRAREKALKASGLTSENLQENVIDKQKLKNSIAIAKEEDKIAKRKQSAYTKLQKAWELIHKYEMQSIGANEKDLEVLKRKKAVAEEIRAGVQGTINLTGLGDKDLKKDIDTLREIQTLELKVAKQAHEEKTLVAKLVQEEKTLNAELVALDNQRLATKKQLEKAAVGTKEYAALEKQLEQQALAVLQKKAEIDDKGVANQKVLNSLAEKELALQNQLEVSKAKQEDARAKEEKAIERLIAKTQKGMGIDIENFTAKKSKFISSEDEKAIDRVRIKLNELNGTSLNDVKNQIADLKLEWKEVSSAINTTEFKETSTVVDELGKDFKRLTTYITGAMVIEKFWGVLREGVAYAKELDEAYTDVAISMDISRSQFNEWTKDARKIAQANGVMTTSIMDMVKIYATSGESISDIQDKLAGTAMIQNITQWDAEKTTSVVNSIISQYKLMEKEINGTTGSMSNAIQYMGDALVGVSNALKVDNVAGIQEIASAIDVAGGIMEQAGASMEWYMGVTGTLNEVMNTTGSEVGNAMKMISARVFAQAQAMEDLGMSSEEVEIEMRKAEKALTSVGVAVREASDPSQLRGLEDILDELAGKWDNLSDATKNYVAEGVAGTNRRSHFVSMMENYERITELAEEGEKAQGALAEANAKRVESLAGQMNIMKDKLMSLMDGLQPVLFGLTDIGNAVLTVANFFGAIPTSITLATTALLSFNKTGQLTRDTLLKMGEAYSPVIAQINSNISAMGIEKQKMTELIEKAKLKISETQSQIIAKQKLGVSTDTLNKKLTLEKNVLQGAQIELAKTTVKTVALQTAMSFGLSLAIGAVVFAVGKMVNAFKEFNHSRSVEGITESINSLNEKVNGYTESVKKLNNVKADVSSMREMVETIKDENTSIEEQQKLTQKVNEMLSGHASSYENIESVLNNENIALGTRIKLLEQEAELQKQLSANKVMEEVNKTDFFGNTSFDNALGQTENLANQLVSAKKILENKVWDIEHGIVFSIKGKTGAIEDASQEFTKNVESIITDIQISATNAGKIMSDYMTLRDAGRLDNTQFQVFKEEYLNTIKQLKEALAEVGREDVEIFNLFSEEMEEAIDQALELQNKILKDFDKTYVNPLAFEDTGDLDKAIDRYQELYEANESLVDILNEASAIEFKDGHPFSKNFSDLLDADLDNLENFESALLTINELFEDMSATDLSKMFGEDFASQIQEVLSIDVATPFDEMSDAARQAVEGVIGSFGAMEDELKSVFYRLNATNGEFYQELQEKNASVFQNLSDRWGVSASDYANVAEYKRAVDQQVYAELMQMDSNALNQLYQNTLTLLGIKEEAGEERVSMEDQAAFLINGIDVKELKAKLENEKKALEAKKAELEGELKAQESQANNALSLQDDTSVKSLQMMNTLSQRAQNHYNTFYGRMSATGSLDGVAISAMTGRATVNTSSLAQGSVTAKALQNITDKIAKIDGLIANLESYEKLSSGDLTFNLTPYNPTKSPTTSAGGYSPSDSKGSKDSSTEKVVEDLDLVIDRYYELNDALDDVNNALEMNRQLQESATDMGTIKKLHKEEIALLKEKLEATKKLQQEQRNEMLDQKNLVASAGFKFDKEGNITNYSSRLQAMQKYANSLTGEAKEAQIAYVNSIVEAINAYTTLTNSTIPSTELAIEQLTQEIKEVNKEHEKTIQLIETLGDRYYEINGQITDVENRLALNQAKQKNATPSERVKLMEEEIALMKERQELIAQQKSELETEANEIAKKLGEKGVEFNADGTIKNYKQLMQNLTTVANQYVGDTRDEMVEDAETLIDLIEQYDDIIRNTLPDLAVEWEEYTSSIREAEKAMAQTVTDIQKDVTSAIQNELQKRTDAVKTELQKQKDAYNKQFEEEDWEDSLNSEQKKLDEIQQAINNLSRDTSLAGQLKLQQLREEYEAQQKVIDDMIHDKEKENGNNRFDEEMEKLDQELEEALDPQNIADLVNKALVDGFVTIGDEVVALDSLMSDWLNETGDGLYAMGDILREELIDNLRVAQELMAGMGLTSTGVNSNIEQNLITPEMEVALQNLLSAGGKNQSSTANVSIGSLIEVKGNVTEDVLPKLESMIEEAKTELVDEIAREITRR